mgnify:CR=1 FL=1
METKLVHEEIWETFVEYVIAKYESDHPESNALTSEVLSFLIGVEVEKALVRYLQYMGIDVSSPLVRDVVSDDFSIEYVPDPEPVRES